jgi:FixJ family two-component response regulator
MATRTKVVVAVIDDDMDILESVKYLLSACGYDAELYASSEAFLAAVSSTAATCLIVDIQIGNSDGIELVSQLKTADFNFPTIFMSGSAYGTVQKRIEKVGCVAFLRKPFSADLLAEALVSAAQET